MGLCGSDGLRWLCVKLLLASPWGFMEGSLSLKQCEPFLCDKSITVESVASRWNLKIRWKETIIPQHPGRLRHGESKHTKAQLPRYICQMGSYIVFYVEGLPWAGMWLCIQVYSVNTVLVQGCQIYSQPQAGSRL